MLSTNAKKYNLKSFNVHSKFRFIYVVKCMIKSFIDFEIVIKRKTKTKKMMHKQVQNVKMMMNVERGSVHWKNTSSNLQSSIYEIFTECYIMHHEKVAD